jgi:recombination protein RecR
MIKYPLHLLKLVDTFRKLPGVGTKTAERFAFELSQWPNDRLQEMAKIIQSTSTELKHCHECGCLSEALSCPFCLSASDARYLCIVAMPRDVFAIEATREYQGLYHVLGALLSPLDGIGPERLNIDKLKQRLTNSSIEEVIIALDSTLEGDATALYLKQEFTHLNVRVTRLAFGLPMGSTIDYVDGGTLARALSARARF